MREARHRNIDGDPSKLRSELLYDILVRKEVRKVSSDLVVHYSQRLYRIMPTQETLRAAKKRCTVLEREDGCDEIRVGAMTLSYSVFDKSWATVRAPVVAGNGRLSSPLVAAAGLPAPSP